MDELRLTESGLNFLRTASWSSQRLLITQVALVIHTQIIEKRW